ncbi:D-alanyl-D-alanine carboxypeptidase/D-alanyl-D-alanine endopeptidase [Limnofasciculus baicalensis]|nr:D-alanyl-D-alanine carboxypeptidase/D-alanyl-D-alanine-endopeptidase [Limnofasciculus baicalensis]
MLNRLPHLGKPLGLLLLLLEVQLAVRQKPVAAQVKQPIAIEESQDICPANLPQAIESITNRPEFRYARWGILIQTQFTQAILYSHDRDRYFIPASNIKLLTTAAALHRLGANFQIRTSVYGSNTEINLLPSPPLPLIPNQVTEKTIKLLRLVGRGDPSLSDSQLRDLAQQLKRRGISHIQELRVEEGYFSQPTINQTWEWGDISTDYGTSVNSLILNQNAASLTLSPQSLGQPLQVTWGDAIAGAQWNIENNTVTSEANSSDFIEISGILGKPILQLRGQLPVNGEAITTAVAILDPSEYFLAHFQNILATEGIKVENATVSSNIDPQGEPELAAVESPSLAALLVETNQNSNNLYGEALLRTLASVTQVNKTESTAEAGIQQVKATLTELGVNPESYIQADGAGLSRQNLVTPAALVKTLQAMAETPEADIYRASLSVSGVSGTLSRRFRDTAAQGILQGKTGTMTGISALSGYLDTPNYQPLVFSIILNQGNQPSANLRQAIDQIVLLLTRLHSC